MERFVTALAFVLGFTGVMALASGSFNQAASQTDGRTVDTPRTAWISLPRTPDAIAPAGSPSHTSIGTLMPDGTYYGLECPPWYVEQLDPVQCPSWYLGRVDPVEDP